MPKSYSNPTSNPPNLNNEPSTGGRHQDPQDAEAHLQRPAAQRAHRHPQEHVPAVEEDGEGADRVAHRAQVHEEGRGQHQHVHLHGVECGTDRYRVVQLDRNTGNRSILYCG